MRLRDKVWIIFFLLTGVIFSASIAYEFLYMRLSYLKTEEGRMGKVFSFYEQQLDDYLIKKSEFAEEKYILNGRPLAEKLKKQDTFLLVEGEKGSWNTLGEEAERIRKTEKG